jgi:hypothetical protein
MKVYSQIGMESRLRLDRTFYRNIYIYIIFLWNLNIQKVKGSICHRCCCWRVFICIFLDFSYMIEKLSLMIRENLKNIFIFILDYSFAIQSNESI